MEELKDKNKVKNVLANTSNSNFETIKNNLFASSDSNSEKELITTLTNASEEGAPQNVLGESSEMKVENKKKKVKEKTQIKGGQGVSDENSEGLLSIFKELKSDKENTDEKVAKCAIMARNLSHNIGSHVLSYLGNEVEEWSRKMSWDKLQHPADLRGIRHLLRYLQERQDFLATIATFNVPYFTPLPFKETIFDFINPHLKNKRHPRVPKTTNFLLKYIAKSEDLNVYDEKHKLQVVLYDRRNECIIVGDEPNSVDFLHDYTEMFPGGDVGRQAILSIVENMIRNAAKHEHHKDGSLSIFMELYHSSDEDIKTLFGDDELVDQYLKATDRDKLDYLALSYIAEPQTIDTTVNKIQKVIREGKYVDEHGTALGENKGLKEMRISASWLRGETDEWKYPDRVESYNLSGNDEGEITPLLSVRQSSVHINGEYKPVIQFVFGMRRFIPFAVIGDGYEDINIEVAKDRDVVYKKNAREYQSDRFSNCAEYTLVANEKILKEIRPTSYNRIVVVSPEEIVGKTLKELETLAPKLYLRQNVRGCNDKERLPEIYIQDDENKDSKHSYAKRIISDSIIFDENEDFSENWRYVYKKHLDGIEGEGFITALRYEGDLYPSLCFAESITGSNSTDRLLRSSVLDEKWYYQQLYAMQKNVAIFDERIYDLANDSTKAILFKLKGVYLFYIDDSFKIHGLLRFDDYSNAQTVIIGSVKKEEGRFSIYLEKEFRDAYPEFDYLTIHQGLLDKIYEKLIGIKAPFDSDDTKFEIYRVTNEFCRAFLNSKESDKKTGFYAGLTIHSGRSKPEEYNMPQKVPFIQYSALSSAIHDCKYTLINLLDYSKVD